MVLAPRPLLTSAACCSPLSKIFWFLATRGARLFSVLLLSSFCTTVCVEYHKETGISNRRDKGDVLLQHIEQFPLVGFNIRVPAETIQSLDAALAPTGELKIQGISSHVLKRDPEYDSLVQQTPRYPVVLITGRCTFSGSLPEKYPENVS